MMATDNVFTSEDVIQPGDDGAYSGLVRHVILIHACRADVAQSPRHTERLVGVVYQDERWREALLAARPIFNERASPPPFLTPSHEF